MSQRRVGMLDLLRGGAMILVVLYHFLYDLVIIAQVNLPQWLTPGQPVMEKIHIGFCGCCLWCRAFAPAIPRICYAAVCYCIWPVLR